MKLSMIVRAFKVVNCIRYTRFVIITKLTFARHVVESPCNFINTFATVERNLRRKVC